MDGRAPISFTSRRVGFVAALILIVGSTASIGFSAERNESKPTPTKSGAAIAPQAPAKLTAPELAREIDRHVDRALKSKNTPVSARSDDSEFLRRAYLDIAGVIPPLERVEPFLADARADKRARLIDELLKSEEYVRHSVDQWREHLIPNTAAAGRRRHETGIVWLEEAFRENRSYDEFIRGVLTVDGFQRDHGAATFLVTHQSLDEMADRFSKVLLGVQITCAQCHNHPFADWKQDDYWGIAAFFSKVKHQYERIDRVEHYGVSERGDRKPLMTPPSLKVVPPTFLGGVRPTLDPNAPYLPTFVDWLASADNPYFARAFANRLWRSFMGRGLVEPVDDLRHDNPGTHPELLTLLGDQFRMSGFDIHYLIRAMMLSETYQRTSRPLDANRDDVELYSHMPVRVMSPYVLTDSITAVFRIGDAPREAADAVAKAKADSAQKSDAKTPDKPDAKADPKLAEEEKVKAQIRLRGTRDSYASFFKGEDGAAPTAYETGVPQALRLMNGQEMYRGTRIIAELSRKYPNTDAQLEQIYLAVLARRPTAAEREIVAKHLKSHSDPRNSLNDVIWALLNSTEFLTNH